jgi:anthraniloyl-CoA monooxygenase
VKVVVIGGGPGGLYAALLLKNADPRRDVTVFERNPPDATYGWGVVFSDETLTSLRDADEPTHRAITESFALWDSIEVRFRGERLRVSGNVFAGLSRQALLGILQRRCAELGVSLVFGREVAGAAAFPDADLVVAADGINSGVRRAHAEHFRPSFVPHPRKYVWLGTDWRPDAFIFICRDTEHGLFQGTIYPYDDRMSTFVVEVDDEPWRRAGLDRADERQTIAFCERLFAEDLGGRRLLSNKSDWISFVTVRNATWHHGRTVLLGDAAHTAHYTIGSGTKLAMEDAIALAQAFARHRDVDAALAYYEQGREPVVERIQEAALESYAWYAALGRYAALDPIQFAFAFFTRSGRITYDGLKVRDPRFVEAVDRWFAARSRPAGSPVLVAPPPMFTPIRIRGTTLLNRVVLVSPPLHAATDGVPGDAHRAALLALATGGAGLVVTEMTAVSPEGRVTPQTAGLYHPTHLAEWKAIVDAVHGASLAKIALRLGHAGRRGASRPCTRGLDLPVSDGGWSLLAPSPLAYHRGRAMPIELDRAGLDVVRAAFAQAARMAAEVGFDVLHLDAAHGYLLASFLSPLSNVRQDAYGGTRERRLRFPLEVFDAVRSEWPDDRPLTVCLVASDRIAGGLEPSDAVEIARTLREHGADAIEVAVGQTTPAGHVSYAGQFLTPFSDAIRHAVGLPTIVRGGITSADAVNTIVAAGRADLCIVDPLH